MSSSNASHAGPRDPYRVTCPTRETYTILNQENNHLMKSTLNDSQVKVLDQLEKMIVERNPTPSMSLEVQDTCTLIRFLRARDFNVEKAYELYVQRMEWIERVKPHKITAQEVEQELQSGLLFFYGRDFFGRPIVYARTCNHFSLSTEKQVDAFFKYFVYMCELALMNVPNPPYNQFVIVSDQSFLGRKNMDTKGYKSLFCLGNYYPEVIHCIHILKTPLVFNLMYKIGKQFVDKKTLAKIQIHGKKDTNEALSKVTDCLLPDHCISVQQRQQAQDRATTWLPECCPEQFVFAKLRAKTNMGLNGPTEAYSHGYEDESEDNGGSTEATELPVDGINDLDLD